MLAREYRLKNRQAFSATYRVKNSFYKDGIVLFAGKLKTDIETPTRVGFVVSKKTHKRAVKRNRLKRLMRESYRLLLKSGELGNSQKYMSLIFIGHSGALGNSFEKIQFSVKYLLKGLK